MDKTSYTYLKHERITTSAVAPHNVSDNSQMVKLTRFRRSVPNPNYKQIIADGGNATTALTAYETSLTIQPGVTRYTFADGSNAVDTEVGIKNIPLWVNDQFMGGNISQSMVDKASAQATARIYSSIRQFQTPFEGQIFAGELKEVFELIKAPLHKSAKLTDELVRALSQDRSRTKFVKGVKRGNLSPLSKSAADLWLEYRFAVLPLFGDVASLLTLAADVANKRQHTTVRGYGDSIKTVSNSTSQTTSSGWVGGLNSEENKFMVQNIIRAGMEAKFLDSLDNGVNPWVNSVDDVMSIPVTAWELLPFSFLIDYFVNVGDIISSAVVTQRSLSYVSNSMIYTAECRQSAISGYISDNRVRSINLAERKTVLAKSRYVNRTSTFAGIPPVVFSLPGSKVRYANIAALLTSWYK